jgi:SUMO ligase MMS21 Smc5/6 complex component
MLCCNQRAALEDAVRERTMELREKIAELEATNQGLQKSSALSGV